MTTAKQYDEMLEKIRALCDKNDEPFNCRLGVMKALAQDLLESAEDNDNTPDTFYPAESAAAIRACLLIEGD